MCLCAYLAHTSGDDVPLSKVTLKDFRQNLASSTIPNTQDRKRVQHEQIFTKRESQAKMIKKNME
jgi:hypothetical protein